MYRKVLRKGDVCYCPVCCQFGKPAIGAREEGVTKSTKTPIQVCSKCAPVEKQKKNKYLPSQGLLTFPE